MLIFKGLNLSKTFQSVPKGVVLFLVWLSSCFFFVLLLFYFFWFSIGKRRRKEKVLQRGAKLPFLTFRKEQ